MFEELTEAQRQAAYSDGPTLVLAGAGTGKTKTLTSAAIRRINDGVHPNHILAVTFTNKAAAEMKDRIVAATKENPPQWFGTFHGIGGRLLRWDPSIAGLRERFNIADADDAKRILKRAMKSLGLETKVEQVNQMARAIEVYKDWLCTPEDAPRRCDEIIRSLSAMNMKAPEEAMMSAFEVYQRYQQYLREANVADFSDLLMWPTLAMVSSDRVRQSVAARWDVLLADEYQDVNYSQYRFLNCLGQDHRQIFAVGDDDQAIYGFRYANVAYIRRFTEDYPDANVIRLEQNFRSTANILEAANAVIEKDHDRLGKTLFTEKDAGDLINVLIAGSPDDEAREIAKELEKRNASGVPWSEMAILYRANFVSRPIEDTLARRGIPYVLLGDVSYWQRQEIKDALAYMQLALDPDNRQSDEAFRRVANVPSRGLGEKKMNEIAQAARAQGISMFNAAEQMKLGPKTKAAVREFTEAIRTVHESGTTALSVIAHELIETTGYLEMWRGSNADKAEERLENLHDLPNAVGSWDSLEALLEHAALMGREGLQETQDRVYLMSMHRAKGLEFPHVFLSGWEDGIIPSSRSLWDDQMDEERRLAYVGITRCMKKLAITASYYRPGLETGGMSQFVRDIPRNLVVQGWDQEPDRTLDDEVYPRLPPFLG